MSAVKNIVCSLLAVIMLSSCAVNRNYQVFNEAVYSGDYSTALKVLEDPGFVNSANRNILWALEAGYLYAALGKYRESNNCLNYADQLITRPPNRGARLASGILLGTDAIFSFSKFPIRLCLFLGTLGTFVFMCAGIYALVAKSLGYALFGWSSTVLSIYFLGSIQLIFLGVVGEYVYRIYKESQNRPIYLVKKFYDAESE